VIGRPTACLSFNTQRGEKPERTSAIPKPFQGDEDKNLMPKIPILASMEYIGEHLPWIKCIKRN
jgi:hypothetical protein